MTETIDTPSPEPTPTGAPPEAERKASMSKWSEWKVDLKWATALLFVLILALSGALWSSWQAPTLGEEELDDVTASIFAVDGLVAPFEILSVLLLAALIAGVVIAFREREGA